MNPLKSIRLKVFAVTQAEMAQIAGVTQSTVSRWENGVPPSLDEMKTIRESAFARNISWSDSYFFEEILEAAE